MEFNRKKNHLFGTSDFFDTKYNTEIIPTIWKFSLEDRDITPLSFEEKGVFLIDVLPDNMMINSVYTPDSIFDLLTKIGALVALAKIFVVFSLYHEYRFEKQLSKETNITIEEPPH
jgi:hypothetical protein